MLREDFAGPEGSIAVDVNQAEVSVIEIFISYLELISSCFTA